jgi:hypothetical protein
MLAVGRKTMITCLHSLFFNNTLSLQHKKGLLR